MPYDVSVLMPCYRIDSWLYETLDSIKEASKQIEVQLVLAVNNLDGAEISIFEESCRERGLPNITIVNAGKVDLVGALNFGISHCSANLIARMDQDDLMLPERLNTQVHFMNANPEIALIGAAVEIIDTAGNQLGFQKYPQSHKEIVKQLKYGNCFAHPTVMYRKSAIEQIGLYNPLFTQAEDFEMYIRMSKKYLCANLPEVLLKYRINSSQTSQKQSAVQKKCTRAIIISDAIDLLPIEVRLELPTTNGELDSWLKSVNSYVISNLLSISRRRRQAARQILNAVSRSHIALARSSGYPGNRKMKVICAELTSALLLGPFVTLRWATELFRKKLSAAYERGTNS